jgi:hypothetical protein
MLGTGAKIGIGVMGISIIGILVYVYVKSKSTVVTPVAPAPGAAVNVAAIGSNIPTSLPVVSPTAATNNGTGGAGVNIFGMNG